MRLIGITTEIDFDAGTLKVVCPGCGHFVVVRKRLLTFMDYKNMKVNPVCGSNYIEEETICVNCGTKFHYKLLENGKIIL